MPRRRACTGAKTGKRLQEKQGGGMSAPRPSRELPGLPLPSSPPVPNRRQDQCWWLQDAAAAQGAARLGRAAAARAGAPGTRPAGAEAPERRTVSLQPNPGGPHLRSPLPPPRERRFRTRPLRHAAPTSPGAASPASRTHLRRATAVAAPAAPRRRPLPSPSREH